MSRVHSSLPLLVQRPSVLGPSSDADAAPDHAAADDWRVQAREAVTTLEGLEAALQLTPSEREGAARALAGGFPMSVTPYYLGLASKTDPACPIRRQCVPVASEGHEVP
ncbi:MAG: KamA family radical SAM protein, partial [Polyangiales bacterium]